MSRKSLIIGASGDIGFAISKKLGWMGNQLILHYNKNKQMIRSLEEELPNEQIIHVVQGDLTYKEGLQSFLEKLPHDVDHVIFASGITHFGLFQEMTDQDMDEMLSLHVKSPWKITQKLLPNMIRKKYGKIILITSIWGDIGASCEVAYSTVKGGQNTFVQALAKELGPSGIMVNGVSPGFIETKMNQHLSEEEQQMIIEEIPMQRKGKPEEVANAVGFLLSDQSSYINGEIIRINGAW
ncbi:SDR family oxidoreductase [Gracilibacillus sp. YIM 98692]|uniref:elongation factor P 5-aminopentanone reductase n=1 Tax=Gracilibacillus sp. YIM 98692 TaxID=2663532 RepID=UPI0013D87F16|nr:SDR family oxidoreductase [Gracilibacillus sp. YIM 98692]